MKKKYQNLFFLFGIAVFVVMLTQLDYREVWSGLRSAGYWFFAVLALWAFLYVFNTATWYIIIRSGSGGKTNINFFWLYKITVSGFALNYTTPCGLMGGEPYRIMALSPKIGAERASSSVILYAMTHIFSHFIFWLLSILIYVCTEPLDNFIVNVILLASLAFCVLGVWFFIKGYRKGMAVRLMNFMRHVPGVKKWARGFIERHKQQLDTIDCQIAALHNQNRKSFAAAVLLEPNTEGYGVIDSILRSDGSGELQLYMKAGGSRYPASLETVQNNWHTITWDGHAVFKAAVSKMADVSVEMMERHKLSSEDIRYLVPHQANLRIIDATARRMGITADKCMINIDRNGNTTAATIPSCLYDYEKELRKGDNLILSAFGGGYTWGAIYVKWAYDGEKA